MSSSNPNRSEFDTHHGWAVNVKDRVLYEADPDDVLGYETVQAIYERHQEACWEDFDLLAQERGFREVYSAGRMSGWAVVQPQPADYIDGLELHNFKRKMTALARDFHEVMDYHREEFLAE